jgi:hypothetical protein
MTNVSALRLNTARLAALQMQRGTPTATKRQLQELQSSAILSNAIPSAAPALLLPSHRKLVILSFCRKCAKRQAKGSCSYLSRRTYGNSVVYISTHSEKLATVGSGDFSKTEKQPKKFWLGRLEVLDGRLSAEDCVHHRRTERLCCLGYK